MNNSTYYYGIGMVCGSIWPLYFGWGLVGRHGILGMLVGYGIVCALISGYKFRFANPYFGFAVLLVGLLKLVQVVSLMIGFTSILVVTFIVSHELDIKSGELSNGIAVLITLVHGLLCFIVAALMSMLFRFMATNTNPVS